MSDRSGWLGVVTLSERAVYALGGLLVLVALALPWLARWRGLVRYQASAAAGQAQSLRPALIELPGGVFRMGSPEEEEWRRSYEGPVHEVEISAFAMCETEVTQAQWQAVMGTNPSDCDAGCGADLPVQNVSWFDALDYLNALTRRENEMRGAGEQLTECYAIEDVIWKDGCTGYRLPTEAEWEYAARADTKTAYSFGDDPAQLGEHAWYFENADDVVHAVATRQANPWGLRDLHGNVWEWVWDGYRESYESGRQKDPRGPPGGHLDHVIRGGGARSASRELRSAHRDGAMHDTTGWLLGLRCAQNLPVHRRLESIPPGGERRRAQ